MPNVVKTISAHLTTLKGSVDDGCVHNLLYFGEPLEARAVVLQDVSFTGQYLMHQFTDSTLDLANVFYIRGKRLWTGHMRKSLRRSTRSTSPLGWSSRRYFGPSSGMSA